MHGTQRSMACFQNVRIGVYSVGETCDGGNVTEAPIQNVLQRETIVISDFLNN